jgi:CO dehydrogenase maturation factor
LCFKIAVSGKGGNGKTSIASLIIRYLKKNKPGPILAVDADANANLGESLGLSLEETIGSIIVSFNDEKMKIPSGLTKGAYLEFRLNEAIVESTGVDLIAMGRGEGTGCYCYPNTVLKKFIDSLMINYTHMVMDNEAGMEHLSRRTTEDIDELLLISDHSIKGIRTVARIRDLISELKLTVVRHSVIINRTPEVLDPNITRELARLGLEPIATIPFDEELRQYDLEQRSLLELPDTSKAVQAISKLMTEVFRQK